MQLALERYEKDLLSMESENNKHNKQHKDAVLNDQNYFRNQLRKKQNMIKETKEILGKQVEEK